MIEILEYICIYVLEDYLEIAANTYERNLKTFSWSSCCGTEETIPLGTMRIQVQSLASLSG